MGTCRGRRLCRPDLSASLCSAPPLKRGGFRLRKTFWEAVGADAHIGPWGTIESAEEFRVSDVHSAGLTESSALQREKTKPQTWFAFLTCLRRPYLFSRKRKDRGEKSAFTQKPPSRIYPEIRHAKTERTGCLSVTDCRKSPRLLVTAVSARRKLAVCACGRGDGPTESLAPTERKNQTANLVCGLERRKRA